jgi:hypothetical protein
VRITHKRSRPKGTKRAEAFITRHFSGCGKHAEEAAAVFLAVEKMCGSRLAGLDPDAALRDVLPEQMSAKDSLEAVEFELALEEELSRKDLVKLAIRRLADENLMKALLGPAAAGSSWDPATIWVRSARGVINERVRLRGGKCWCAEMPSTNETQPTSARASREGARS